MRAAGLIATLAAALAACLATAAAPAAHSPVCTRGNRDVVRDPRKLRALDGSPLEPAMAAALRFESASSKARALGASLAVVDPRRGPVVKHECGARVWNRTVVVYLRREAYPPKQKRSQGVLFVGRFPGGYRVWQVAQ